MKKIAVAVVVFFAFAQSQAQVTFKPGIRAGVNFSHFTQGDAYYNGSGYYDTNGIFIPDNQNGPDFKSKTDFYIGLFGALHLTKFYTLQPEVDYSRQGAKVEYLNSTIKSTDIDVSYISLGIINKFTFSDKFNIHVGPTIDVLTDKSRNLYQPNNSNSYYYNSDINSEIDLAFVLGLGVNFTKNFGFEARIKKGIIPVLDWSGNHTNVVFSAGLNYTFDLK